MRALLWVVRIYIWLIIIWAVSTWLGGFPGAVGRFLDILMWPAWGPFGWARLGFVGLGPVVVLLVLFAVEGWLKRQIGGEEKVEPPSAAEEER